MPLVIGISGKIGTGKTTVSGMLQAQRISSSWRDLGDEVKKECSELFEFPLEHCYSPEGKERVIIHQDLPMGSMRVRHILQWWGTDVRRAQDRSYWIKRLQEWILANNPTSLIVGDVRFIEEAQWVLNLGGWIFRIEPYDEWEPPAGSEHSSETELDSWTGWHNIFLPQYGELQYVANTIAEIVQPPYRKPKPDQDGDTTIFPWVER